MSVQSLRDKCRINTNYESDTFVGLKAVGGNISISFPLGYRLGETEEELRKDIILLMNVLSKNTERRLSELNKNDGLEYVDMPIQAYLHVIYDFYARGYYKERETIYKTAKSGKIHWGKTIKTQKAYVQDNDVYYLDFVTKRKNIKEDELITLIHRFCVYESFYKIGWIYTSFLPEKPNIKFNKKMFIGALRDKLSKTFNDKNRKLFLSMIQILNSMGQDEDATDFICGTNRFEYVWEAMIDKAYGIKNKSDYFPKTRWKLPKKTYDNASLEPDTIMLHNGKVYVIDAKYYKFGATGNPSDLPESTSINKQITYGEYIAETNKFKDKDGNNPIVYNAFLMPYDAFGEKFHTGEFLYYVGTAESDWKATDGLKTYEEVIGVLVDVKGLMKRHSKDGESLAELSNLIDISVERNG